MNLKKKGYRTPKRPREILGWYPNLQDKRGRPFNRQMQAAIFSVYEFMKEESDKKELIIPLSRVRERVAKALKISKTTVDKYVARGLKDEKLETPGKLRSRKKPKRDVSETVKDEIRELVYNFCSERRTVTLDLLQDQIRQEKIEFHGCTEVLRRMMHDMNFRYSQRDASLRLLEQPFIRNLRRKFLFQYMQYKLENKYFVYQDETWVFRRGSHKTREWQDGNSRSCSIKNNSSGCRYIICHAGGTDGFVPEAELLLNTKKKPQPFDDYHGNMNGDMFHKWFRNRLLPRLEKPSVIVMDNASYHKVQEEKHPVTNWKKEEIEEWLNLQKIPYDRKATKEQLLIMCKDHKKPKNYVINKILDEHAAEKNIQHTILRLPPYHYFYNPIELIWGILKRAFDKNIGIGNDYSDEAMDKAWQQSLAGITSDVWENCCLKVEARILEDYYKEEVDELDDTILDVRSDNDDDDDDDEDDEDDNNDADDNDHSLKCVKRNLLNAFSSEIKKEENASIAFEETRRAVESIIHFSSDGNDELLEEDISPDASMDIVDWINKKPDNEEIQCGVREKMVAEDFKRLVNPRFLNDKIINGYLELIGLRSGNKICIKDTFFMSRLLKPCGLLQSRKKVDVFSFDTMFIPINSNLHWTLCVVHFQEKKISYYDSLGSKSDTFNAIVEQYLKKEYGEKRNKPWEKLDWKTEIMKGIPEQDNGVDCGVFVCAYADYIARNAPMDFTAKEMPAIRRRMAREIINGKLELEIQSLYHSSSEAMLKRTLSMEKRCSPLVLKRGKYTDLERVTLYESASFHQGDRRFPPDRANAQCTAIATFAIAAITSNPAKISQQLLNNILIEGDKYYLESKRKNNVSALYLQPEDLLKSLVVFKKEMFLEKFQCGEGHYSGDAETSLAKVITNCQEISGNLGNELGYLFIGHGKTVAFTVISVNPTDFFLFNSHCVDETNCYPIKKPKEGRARLFRCRSVDSMCKLLLANDPRDDAVWQVYLIQIYH